MWKIAVLNNVDTPHVIKLQQKCLHMYQQYDIEARFCLLNLNIEQYSGQIYVAGLQSRWSRATEQIYGATLGNGFNKTN